MRKDGAREEGYWLWKLYFIPFGEIGKYTVWMKQSIYVLGSVLVCVFLVKHSGISVHLLRLYLVKVSSHRSSCVKLHD